MREDKSAPLARRSPDVAGLTPFSAFRDEMDRLFETYLAPERLSRMGFGDFPFSPAIDLTENNGEVRLRAELPGVAEKDVDIQLDGDLLTIRGEKKDERREDGDTRRVVERSYGAFARSLRLPFAPKDGDVKAAFENGVLTINAKKPPELERPVKRIPIESA